MDTNYEHTLWRSIYGKDRHRSKSDVIDDIIDDEQTMKLKGAILIIISVFILVGVYYTLSTV